MGVFQLLRYTLYTYGNLISFKHCTFHVLLLKKKKKYKEKCVGFIFGPVFEF